MDLFRTSDQNQSSDHDGLLVDIQWGDPERGVDPQISIFEFSNTVSFSESEEEQLVVVCHGFPVGALDGKTETLLSAESIYELWRSDSSNWWKGITGSFAICLVDRGREEVTVVSDKSRVRNWFYKGDKHSTVLASHLKNLPDNKINNDVIPFLLHFGYLPPSKTIYEDVGELPAGLPHTFSRARLDGVTAVPPSQDRLSKRDFQLRNKALGSREQAIATLYADLLSACEARVVPQGHVGVLLGGFDSALVAALFKRIGCQVTTFSYSWGEESLRQPNVSLLSGFLQSEHVWVEYSKREFKRDMLTYGLAVNHPSNWPHYPMQTRSMSRTLLEYELDLIATGDGCDGLFLGFPGLRQGAALSSRADRIPDRIALVLLAVLSRTRASESLGHPARVLQRLCRQAIDHSPCKHYFNYRLLDPTSIGHLLELPTHVVENSIAKYRDTVESNLDQRDAVSLAFGGKSEIEPGRLKIGALEDATGLPVFSPYQSQVIRALVSAMPREWLHSSGKAKSLGKEILAEMAVKYELLPSLVVNQPKVNAVKAPIDLWIRQPDFELQEFFERLPFYRDNKAWKSLLNRPVSEKIFARSFSNDGLTSHVQMLLISISSLLAGDGEKFLTEKVD